MQTHKSYQSELIDKISSLQDDLEKEKQRQYQKELGWRKEREDMQTRHHSQIQQVNDEKERVRTNLQKELEQVRYNLQKELEQVRYNLQKELEQVRQTLHDQMEQVRSDLTRKNEQVRLTLSTQMEQVRTGLYTHHSICACLCFIYFTFLIYFVPTSHYRSSPNSKQIISTCSFLSALTYSVGF